MNPTIATGRQPLIRSLLGGLVIAILQLFCVSAALAQTGPVLEVNLPAQPMDMTLRQLADKHKLQIGFNPSDVRGVVAPEIRGRYTVEAVLQMLTAGTSLSYSFNGQDTVVIKGAAQDGKEGAPPRAGRSSRSSQEHTALEQRGEVVRGEGIVVTATKREERAQDIPMSIAVIGAHEIERRGLIGMADYLRSIPSVSQIDRGGRDNAIVIRGISTSPEFENASSGTTVATYFDETPITGAAGRGGGGVDVRPVDMQRIEVLRGPQGTAYGSASLGGTVRLIPAKPILDEFSGKVATSYSSTAGQGGDNSMVRGVLNIPVVSEMLALRLVGYRYDDSGFYRNVAGNDPAMIAFAERFGLGDFVRGHTEEDVGRMRTTGGRAAALWQVTDKLDLSMNLLTQRIKQDGSPLAMIGTFDQSRGPIAPQGRVRGEAGEINDSNIDLLNVVLNYNLGWAALTSAASWVDGGSVSTTGAMTALPTLGPSSNFARSGFESFTAETRLASQFGGPFQFLGGLFYERVEEDYLQHSGDWPGTPATNPLLLLRLPATDPMFISDVARDLDQRAVFGEASYDLTEKLTATLGGRYFRYEKNERTLQEGGLVRVPLGTGIPQILRSSHDGTSYKANLNFKPTKDSLLYASWAQGFRLGRPSAGLPSVTCDTDGDGLIDGASASIESTRRIDSDYLDNYEIGGKFAFFDRRMVVDTAVYHIKWRGLPIRAIVPPPCNSSYTANAGAATSDGVEIQASVFVAKGLRFDFGGGYTRAELSEDAPGLRALAGARLPGSPKWSANLAAQYDFNVAGYKAFVRADSFYVGEFYGDLFETPGTRAGDYVKVDARAGAAIRNLTLELFVHNLTNKDAVTWRGLTATPSFAYRLRPRTVGIQIGYSFK